MTTQALFGAPHHPVVVTPRADAGLDALLDDLSARPTWMPGLLVEHGGVLLRGFRIDDAPRFQRCAEALGAVTGSYAGGNSPRTQVAGDVFTSTEFPASETISLHQEMSYLPQPPRRLFFHCQIPAPLGGQTTLAHAGDVLRALPPAIVDAFRARRLRYVRTFHPEGRLGKTWQSTWGTDDCATVERAIVDQGSAFRWLDDGGLRVETLCDGLARHPATGEELWFNQAEQWHASALAPATRALLEASFGAGNLAHHCEFEDGPIAEDMLAQIRATLRANRLLFDWRRGDVLMVDNLTLMHGREPFRGSRRTLVILSRS
jgi:alpha-ketoglutarate-dependent taurine dioxygenase